jgi:molybdenum cofactor cytidylyltransferase
MGRPKPLLEFDGRSCLEVVLDACLEGGASEAIVVIAPDGTAIGECLAGRTGVRIALNERPERGQTSSVKAGLAALPPESRGFFILPADHPLIDASNVAILVERFEARSAGRTIFVPAYRGRRGHPVLMQGSHRERIAALADDVPLRDYMRAREGEVEVVPVENAGVVTRMNTLDEYRAALDAYRRRRAGSTER